MLLRITAHEKLLPLHPHQSMQDVSFAVGRAPDQHDIPSRRQGLERFKLYYVAVMKEGKHTAPRGCQPNVLTPR
jgi:hypothetical protein